MKNIKKHNLLLIYYYTKYYIILYKLKFQNMYSNVLQISSIK